MRRLLTLGLALSLVLAACSSDDGEATDATSTTVADETTTTSINDETTTTAETATTTTTVAPAAGSGGDSCLVGTWEFDLEAFVETMREIAVEEGGLPEDFTITPSEGSYVIEMKGDGTFEGVRDDWGFAFELDEGEMAITMNGTEEGTWSADEDTINVAIAESQTEVVATLTSGGVSTVLPTSPIQLPEAIATDSQYECDSETLSVTTDGNTAVLRRSS